MSNIHFERFKVILMKIQFCFKACTMKLILIIISKLKCNIFNVIVIDNVLDLFDYVKGFSN